MAVSSEHRVTYCRCRCRSALRQCSAGPPSLVLSSSIADQAVARTHVEASRLTAARRRFSSHEDRSSGCPGAPSLNLYTKPPCGLVWRGSCPHAGGARMSPSQFRDVARTTPNEAVRLRLLPSLLPLHTDPVKPWFQHCRPLRRGPLGLPASRSLAARPTADAESLPRARLSGVLPFCCDRFARRREKLSGGGQNRPVRGR